VACPPLIVRKPFVWALACVIAAPLSLYVAQALWGRPPRASSEKRRDFLILLGSGTVLNYLRHVAPDVLNREADDGLQVGALDLSTRYGIQVFKEVYLHGEPRSAYMVLAMCADQQCERVFGADTVGAQRGKFFELCIGKDELTVTLGAPNAAAFESAFGTAHDGLMSRARGSGDDRTISTRDLAYWVWRPNAGSWRTGQDSHYKVSVPIEGSATRERFERALRAHTNTTSAAAWPDDVQPFDPSGHYQRQSNLPWIILGSKWLTPMDSLRTGEAGKLTRTFVLVNDRGETYPRGLYLYGRLPSSPLKDYSGSEYAAARYDITPPVAQFLANLFTSEGFRVAARESGIDLKAQEEFLHLTQQPRPSAWIAEQPGGDARVHIYRAAGE
jgi:hypothetical protein